MRSSRRPSRTLAPLLVLGLLVAGCSGTSPKKATTPPATPTSTVGTPSASPTPVAEDVDLLTGTRPRRTGPVVAVKIDNALLARPYQRGLTQAAVIYQELVEGGSTRLMAVFESESATSEVGPVRSARESDLDVLRAYGRPDLAFSGANSGVLAIIGAAARAGHVVDVSYEVLPSSYRLGEQRRDARNFFTVPSVLAGRRPGSGVSDVGLRFGPVPTGPATPALLASFSSQSTLQVRYDAATHRYVLSQGGRVLPVSPANVVVQVVRTQPSRFQDVHRENTPLTVSTGSGAAFVLRDGVRVAATWTRVGFGATHYLAAGRDVPLRPGPTWVLLLPSTGSTAFR